VRVLLTTMRDPGQIGGTSTHIDMLARGLEELGHEVGVLWLGATIPAPVRKAGLVWTAGALNRMRTGWGMVYSAEMRGRLSAAATDRALKKAAASGAPWDVVNAQEVYSVPGLREVADARGVPLVLTLHGYPLFESVSEGYTSASRAGERYLMRAEMRALRLADAIVTVDTRLYRHALRLVPERADRVYTLMNFIDTSAFAPIEDPAEEVRLRRELRDKWDVPLDKVVLFCPRRLVKKNGVVYPSLALAAMDPSERDRFLLLHAGEGGELQAISEAVEENRLEKNVRLLGGQGRDAILELYRLSDIVLVPSVHSENVEEATSLAALEAMASGRPLIAGKVGGLAEMVSDGETGLLVPGDAGVMDPDALAAAILRLAGDRDAGARMADAARRYVVENHSHLRAAAAYADIYRQTIQIGASGWADAGLAPGMAAVRSGVPAGRATPPGAATSPGRATSPALVARGTPWPTRSVLGFTLDLVDLESAAQWLAVRARAQTSGKTPGSEPGSRAGSTAGKTAGATTIATTIAVSFNPELVVKAQRDPAVAEALLGADLCYPDGVGAVWAAGRQGAAPERVPGIDLAGRVLELATAEGLPVFLLGATDGVAEEAARRQIQRLPGLTVAGTHHGYFMSAQEDEVVGLIRASGASILLAALGAPRQELFMFQHRGELGVPVALGVGGSFDVWAGVVKRAPAWAQRARAEWLYRLAADPRRLRRQLSLPRFAAQVVRWSPDDYGPPRRGRARHSSGEG